MPSRGVSLCLQLSASHPNRCGSAGAPSQSQTARVLVLHGLKVLVHVRVGDGDVRDEIKEVADVHHPDIVLVEEI